MRLFVRSFDPHQDQTTCPSKTERTPVESVAVAGEHPQTRDMESHLQRPRVMNDEERYGRGNASSRSRQVGASYKKDQRGHLQPYGCGAPPQGPHTEVQGGGGGSSSITNINMSPFGSLNMYGSHCRDTQPRERAPSDPRSITAEELAENRRKIRKMEEEIKEMEKYRKRKEQEIEEMKKHWRQSLENIKAKIGQGFAEIMAMKNYIDPRPGSKAPSSRQKKVPFEGAVPAFAQTAPINTAPPTATMAQQHAKSTWRRGRQADPPALASLHQLLRAASERRTQEILSAAKTSNQQATSSERSTDAAPGPAPPEPAASAPPLQERVRRRRRRPHIAQPSAALLQTVDNKNEARPAKQGKMKLRVSIPISIIDEDKENVYIRPVPIEERRDPVLPPEDHGNWWL